MAYYLVRSEQQFFSGAVETFFGQTSQCSPPLLPLEKLAHTLIPSMLFGPLLLPTACSSQLSLLSSVGTTSGLKAGRCVAKWSCMCMITIHL